MNDQQEVGIPRDIPESDTLSLSNAKERPNITSRRRTIFPKVVRRRVSSPSDNSTSSISSGRTPPLTPSSSGSNTSSTLRRIPPGLSDGNISHQNISLQRNSVHLERNAIKNIPAYSKPSSNNVMHNLSTNYPPRRSNFDIKKFPIDSEEKSNFLPYVSNTSKLPHKQSSSINSSEGEARLRKHSNNSENMSYTSLPKSNVVLSPIDTDKQTKKKVESSPNVPSRKINMERRLFHEIHNPRNSSCGKGPSIKEFKECLAFTNAIKTSFGSKQSFDVVLDVAGGHGALGALMLILAGAKKAVVIDPADVGNGGVENAWGKFYKVDENEHESKGGLVEDNARRPRKELLYRREGLHTGLPAEIENTIQVENIEPQKILVVACHACQHLSEDTIQIATSYGVHVAVMPCCQTDILSGGSYKAFAKSLGLNLGVVMDLLLAGKAMSWNSDFTDNSSQCEGKDEEGSERVKYDVRMKLIDKNITPQNRIIICKAMDCSKEEGRQDIRKRTERKLKAHEKLTRAYDKAHAAVKPKVSKEQGGKWTKSSSKIKEEITNIAKGWKLGKGETHGQTEKLTSSFHLQTIICLRSVAVGVTIGAVIATLTMSRKK